MSDEDLTTKPLVIYHGNCADGFTAAWLANMWHAQQRDRLSTVDKWYVQPCPAVYGKPPPNVTGRRVYILDFSYPPEVMQVICDEAMHVTMIDHHASAIRALEGFMHPRLKAILDDSRSGAYLTSMFFWPDREPAAMVKLVDDRDRWVFSDARTRPFHASLFSRPYAIGEWNRMSQNIDEAVAEGKVIDRKHMKDIHELLDVCTVKRTIYGLEVPTANLPYTLASDACHVMLERDPYAPFAACWYLRADNKMVFSLRSREDSSMDVSVVAKTFGGGGGHVHAAGFATDSWNDIL